MTVLPAIVTVPVREVVAVFEATLRETVPLPVPDAPAVTVIQAAPLTAVQVHPVVPVTVAVKGPPIAVADFEVGETLLLHVAAAACVTVNVLPAAVMVAERVVAAVFAAAV